MSDDNNDLLAQTDKEWDAAIAALSDEELIAYLARFSGTIAENPEAYPGVTDEMIQDVRGQSEVFQKSVERAKAAERELQIANKVVEHEADELLRKMPDSGKGN